MAGCGDIHTRGHPVVTFAPRGGGGGGDCERMRTGVRGGVHFNVNVCIKISVSTCSTNYSEKIRNFQLGLSKSLSCFNYILKNYILPLTFSRQLISQRTLSFHKELHMLRGFLIRHPQNSLFIFLMFTSFVSQEIVGINKSSH